MIAAVPATGASWRAAGLVAAVVLLLALLAVATGAPRAAADVAAPRAPALSVRAAELYAPQTRQTLEATDAGRELPVASATKLMTALVVLEHVRDLRTVYAFPDYATAAADSQIGLRPGERMTVRDLLVAMMLPSADDAAEDLAVNVAGGSVVRFVAMMNATARRLGLRHTHYTTPIGLDTPGNYSTAHDLVRLAAYDLAHERFLARIVALPRATLASGPIREVVNRNDLVADHPWIDGVKTGHTSGAGYVLVASGRRHGMRLISAVLGTDSEDGRDANTLALLDYGFDRFRVRSPVRRGQVLARLPVRDRPGIRVPVRAGRGYRGVLARGAVVRLRLRLPRRLAGPLPAGTVVGAATVLAAGRDGGRARRLATVPVVLRRRLPAVSRLVRAGHFITRTATLAVIAALAALALAGLVVRGRVPSRRPRGTMR